MELLLPLSVVIFMAVARQHVQYVLRRLSRSPLFTLVTILTIAIGVGANSAIFSVVNGVLLKPLPYPEPETLVALWEHMPNIGLKQLGVPPSDYFVFREQNRSFSNMGIWGGDTVLADEEMKSLSNGKLG